MLKLIIVAVILVGLSIAGIAIRLFLVKDGDFRKSCSSVDPATGQKLGCSCEGSNESSCENQ
ncbi:MAG: membrane or secreted protein [Bacteroidales bacterium]|nr:membrane or secreted protein [Bacteroidales bacterium]